MTKLEVALRHFVKAPKNEGKNKRTTEFLRCWYVFVPCISGNGSSPGFLIVFGGNAALLQILFRQKAFSVFLTLQFRFCCHYVQIYFLQFIPNLLLSDATLL